MQHSISVFSILTYCCCNCWAMRRTYGWNINRILNIIWRHNYFDHCSVLSIGNPVPVRINQNSVYFAYHTNLPPWYLECKLEAFAEQLYHLMTNYWLFEALEELLLNKISRSARQVNSINRKHCCLLYLCFDPGVLSSSLSAKLSSVLLKAIFSATTEYSSSASPLLSISAFFTLIMQIPIWSIPWLVILL